MEKEFKGFDLLNKIRKENKEFNEIIDRYINDGLIRLFDDEEYEKMREQNFIPPASYIKDLYDLFYKGYNIGSCVYTSRQLSYSYNDVDLVTGILPVLKGTLNAVKEGGHGWIETPTHIIDTTLMLVIDKSIKSEIGYIEEQRITSDDLLGNKNYQARKEYTNDISIPLGSRKN